MIFPNIPKPPMIDTPRITARTGIATIAGVHGTDSEGLTYHDTVSYDIRILDANGQSGMIESVKPTNKWWAGLVVKVVPAAIGSEWPCNITTRRLLLWVCETPAVGNCDGTTPTNFPSTPIDDQEPGVDPRPVGPGAIPAQQSVVRTSPFVRMLNGLSESDLATLYTVTRAAAMARGLA